MKVPDKYFPFSLKLMLVISCMRCTQNSTCLYTKKIVPMEIWEDQRKVCSDNQM